MKKLFLTTTIAMAFAAGAMAADAVKATIHADQAGAKINKEIYGQFSEHLGSCIYGGLWVGENSPIPAGLAAALPTTTTGWTASVLRKTVPRCATTTGVAPSRTTRLVPTSF